MQGGRRQGRAEDPARRTGAVAASILRAFGRHGLTRGFAVKVQRGLRRSGVQRRRGIVVADRLPVTAVFGSIPEMARSRVGAASSEAVLGTGRSCCAALAGLGGGGAAQPRRSGVLCTADHGGGGARVWGDAGEESVAHWDRGGGREGVLRRESGISACGPWTGSSPEFLA